MNEIKVHEYRRVVFQAGYETGNYGTIFDGTVIQGRRGRESPTDTYIDLLCAVGAEANQKGVSKTLAAGSSSTDAAKAAAAAMGIPFNDQTEGATTILPRGQVLYGMARDEMTDAATGAGATWHYSNAGLTIVDAKSYTSNDVLVLTGGLGAVPGTGLIGWPEATQEGIKVRCLLNPKVSVAGKFQIDNASLQSAEISAEINFVNTLPSPDADGLYRVLYYEHSGDTRGTPWYTDIIGLSIHDKDDSGITSLYQRGLS